MTRKERVKLIKHDLEFTDKTLSSIAAEYEVSRTTVNNINNGKTHKENREYPIRQTNAQYFTDNEVAFVRLLAEEGYSAKQIHIIMLKGSYGTVSNLIARKTRAEKTIYRKDKNLELRRRIYDEITTPREEFINQHSERITLEDAVYIKFLGRFMADLAATVYIFLPLMETEMIAYDHKILSLDDVHQYLEWSGTSFETIWWIKNIFNNKVNNLLNQPIYYDDFPFYRFQEINQDIDMEVVRQMIYFNTKENYRRRPEI